MKQRISAMAELMRTERSVPVSRGGRRRRAAQLDLETRAATENLSSEEVCKFTGATPRMLQWWDERGYVCPALINGMRIYVPALTAKVRAIVSLRKRHVKMGPALFLARNRLFYVESICEALDLLKRFDLRL